MKEPLPGLSTPPASLLVIACGPVVALPWPFLKAALLGLSTAQHLCSCCCIIHIEVFAFGARLWKLCCIVRPDLRYLKSHFLHLCSASILEVSHFHCWLFCWYASGGCKISLSSYVGRLTSDQVFQSRILQIRCFGGQVWNVLFIGWQDFVGVTAVTYLFMPTHQTWSYLFVTFSKSCMRARTLKYFIKV